MQYRPRVLDGELTEALAAVGAVVIEGPKAAGKTETARRTAASEIRMDAAQARQAYIADPDLVLQGPTPRLIDEWQVEPGLWNDVRHAVDDRRAPGQFILTGSAVPRDDESRHSGAGRFARLRMRPMSLAESGHSTASVSIASVLRREEISSSTSSLTAKDLAERIVVGGWPGNLGLNARQALRALSGYVADICQVDVQRLDGIRRDPIGVERLFRSIARNVGTPAPISVLAADANGTDRRFTAETISIYVNALARLMVVEDVPAWAPRLRSRTRLRASSIRQLADPSLATAAMNADPGRLLRDIEWLGFLFESLVIRDLRVYIAPLDGRLFHYRDSNGLEVDAVVELPDGGWAAFEIKLGSSPVVVDAAAANLLKLKEIVQGEPIALGVITGTGFSFVRRDGLLQLAIGSIGP